MSDDDWQRGMAADYNYDRGERTFFRGTYIPKNTRYGQPGLLELIPRINEFWNTRRRELLNSADEIMDALQQTIPAFDAEPLTETALHTAFESFSQNFDEKAWRIRHQTQISHTA